MSDESPKTPQTIAVGEKEISEAIIKVHEECDGGRGLTQLQILARALYWIGAALYLMPHLKSVLQRSVDLFATDNVEAAQVPGETVH